VHTHLDEPTRSSQDGRGKAIGTGAHVAIIVFESMLALWQLGVAPQLIAIAFGLVLGAVCLALALAFGLGGRDVAGRFLQRKVDRLQGPDRQP